MEQSCATALEVIKGACSISISFRWRDGENIWVTGVYCPPRIQGRDQFLNEMDYLFGLCGPIWCVPSDFNMTRLQFEWESQGRRTRSS